MMEAASGPGPGWPGPGADEKHAPMLWKEAGQR